jgi:predicted kinase
MLAVTQLVQELGSRQKCLAAAEAAMQQGCSVVIDRCNFDAEQRSTWVTTPRTKTLFLLSIPPCLVAQR